MLAVAIPAGGMAVCPVLPTGCLPAAGRAAHGCAGEAPCAGRRRGHRGDRARYLCVPLVPLVSPGGGHSPPPLMFQGSSSPGHHICSACCDHKSMLIWSCRYWHPPFAGLLATPSVQARGPCCQAVPAGWLLQWGHPCLAEARSEGAPTGPLLLHPTAGGQEPSSLPSAGTWHGPDSAADCSVLPEGCPGTSRGMNLAQQNPRGAALPLEWQGCSWVGYPLHPPWCSPCCPLSDPFQAYPEYEAFMGRMVLALDPLLDAPPVDTAALGKGSLLQQLRNLQTLKPLLQAGTSVMPGNPDSKGCLPAPGMGNAEPPQEPSLGWQALVGLLTFVLLSDLQSQLSTSSQPWHSHAGLTPSLHPQGWH